MTPSGNQYADPGQPSCIHSGQTLSAMVENLVEMSNTIPAKKIFFYQIADAVRPPEICEDDDGMPRRMKWSRACRVFPCEPPSESPSSQQSNSIDSDSDLSNPPSGYLGFLPVGEMTRLLHHGNGYRGWWSLEVFNKSLQESDEGCPGRHGGRGIDGLHKLWEVVQQDTPPVKTAEALEEELGLGDKYHPSYSDDSTPPLSDIDDYSSSSLESDSASEADEAEATDNKAQPRSKVHTVFAQEKVVAEETQIEHFEPTS
ncbi:hypothetical protein D9758_013561 [Tetrapyrgos nigripes]|uniref:Uncharacterized protein n=1 Tax=Tetrapyrgos nigripes TaxID=182062 RepID=A0A8H5CH14_9AGAR|nr:hypothetical protein D9758_013561 [Tetrapyrgos nigripes]